MTSPVLRVLFTFLSLVLMCKDRVQELQGKFQALEKESEANKRELAVLHSGSDSRFDKTEQLENKLRETKVAQSGKYWANFFVGSVA
jgi:hypothetical protein